MVALSASLIAVVTEDYGYRRIRRFGLRTRLGFYLCSVAACAVLGAAASPAFADEKRATFVAAPDTTIPRDLEAKLEQAIGRVEQAPRSAGEQRRNERRAVQLAEDILRTEGYYGATVEARPASRETDRYTVELIINPGPQFVVRDAGIEWVAPRQTTFTPRAATETTNDTPTIVVANADTGQIGDSLAVSGNTTLKPVRGAPPVHPTEDIVSLANEAIDLPDGASGRAPDVIAAEARVISVLQRNGFADARPDPRYVEVAHPEYEGDPNPAANTLRPRFNIMARDVVYLNDQITLNPTRRTPSTTADQAEAEEREAPTRTREDWVQQLVTWERGEIFTPDALTELERRLTETGVFDAASVSLQPLFQANQDDDELRDVYVYLSDRPHKLLEAGASYATKDGFGLDIFRTHFNRFGRADTLRYGLRLADIDSRIGGEWTRPHFRRPGRTLRVAGWAVSEMTDAYDRQAAVFEADMTQRWGKTSFFSYGVGLDGGRYKETRFDPDTMQALTLDRNLVLFTLRGGAFIDRANDPLNATRGWRARLSVQPTAVTGEDNVFFLRSVGEASTYYPIGERERTVLAGRVKIGSIVGGDELTVPSDRLMYSGGGGSVRGYSYQSINPRLPDNTPRGGLSQFETSLEVRQDIGEKFQAVAFLDGGAIGFQETPNLSNMRYGAGVGVRYKLPFGPVRADVAFPLNKREGDSSFQLYISIGQSF